MGRILNEEEIVDEPFLGVCSERGFERRGRRLGERLKDDGRERGSERVGLDAM